VNEQRLVLPVASTAVQVTIVKPTGKVEPLGGAHLMAGLGSQLSVAVAVQVTFLLEHWPGSAFIVTGAGQARVGGVESTTVNEQELRLLFASVAVQVTLVVPRGKVLPRAGEQTTTGFVSQASAAVAAKVATAPAGLVHSSTRLELQTITGGVVSTTVTVNVQELRFVCASVAVQVTIVEPRGKVLPLAGEQTTTGFASQASAAFNIPSLAASSG
jgi:hypothetical protein